jgi:hypothetical protein
VRVRDRATHAACGAGTSNMRLIILHNTRTTGQGVQWKGQARGRRAGGICRGQYEMCSFSVQHTGILWRAHCGIPASGLLRLPAVHRVVEAACILPLFTAHYAFLHSPPYPSPASQPLHLLKMAPSLP